MKIDMAFTLTVDVPTDDFDEAESLAQDKAISIIAQTEDATGYRLKYQPTALSFAPEIDEQMKKLFDAN
jgi:hypothetical protein